MPLHLMFDEDARIGFAFSDCKSVPVVWVIGDVSVKADNFELFGAVLVEEADGDSHNAITTCV